MLCCRNTRRVVYRVEEGAQRASNPVLDPDYHYSRQKELSILNPVTRKNTSRRRNLEECIDETTNREQNRMTTGPLTDGSHNVVDLEAVETQTTEADVQETTNDESTTKSLYDRPTNNGSLNRESIESSHSNVVVIPIEGGDGDNNCINDSTENLIQSEDEVEEDNGEERKGEKEMEGDEKRNSTRNSTTSQNDSINDATIFVADEQGTNNDESVSTEELNESTEENDKDGNDKEPDTISSTEITADDTTDNDVTINVDGEVTFSGMTDSTEQLIQSDEDDDDEKELQASEDGNDQEPELEKGDNKRDSTATSDINDSDQDDKE